MSDNMQNTDYRDRAGINQHEQLSGAIANSNSTGITKIEEYPKSSSMDITDQPKR